MRILHIITRMILGGAQENTLLTVKGQLERPGWTVGLLTGPTAGPEGTLMPRLEETDARILYEPPLVRAVSPLRDWQAYQGLKRQIREFRPDIVHTHSSKAGILGRLAASVRGVPGIVHTIHGLPFHPYQGRIRNAAFIAAERVAARRCHRIVSVADAMTEQALAAGVGRREQYQTVYSGMETEPFLRDGRDRTALRERYGLPAEATVLVKVARLFELKGHDYLFEAFAELAGRYPQAHLFLVGDGTWRERLERRCLDLGIRGRVTFAGLVPREEVADCLAASDLVVHASLREGLARVLPQGFLSKKPVISFDVDGAREVVRPGETGWLVPPGDTGALAAAIAEALENPDRARAFAEAGRALCRERFDWYHMVERLCAIYEEILANREPRHGRR